MPAPTDRVVPIRAVRGKRKAALTEVAPPHNREAERATLGAIIVNNDLIDVVRTIAAPGHYFDQRNRLALGAALALRDRGEPIDLVTITEELAHGGQLDEAGGPAYVASLIDGVPRSANAEYYARIVRRLFGERAIKYAAEDVLAQLAKNPDGSGAAIEELRRLIDARQDGPLAEHPIRLLDDVSILEQPDPNPLIPGYWWQASCAATYSPPGLGKTALFISKGIAIASGRRWFGITPSVCGPVVHIVGEGSAFLKFRVLAAKLEAGLDLDTVVGFHVIPEAIDFMDPAKVRALIERLRPLKPVEIGVDTLTRAMAFAGGEDSSQRDISVVINNADMVRSELGAAVHLLHHTGWNEDRERGSSALRGAVDTLASISDTDGVLTLKCEKQKDGPDFPALQFRLKPVDLGPGPDGRPRSACVAVPVDAIHEDVQADLSTSNQEALDVLVRTFPNGATQTQWLAAMPAGYHPRKLYRVRAALLERDLVVERGGKLQAKTTVKTDGN